MVTLPRCQQTLCCAACVQSSSKQLLMAVGLYSRNTKAAWVPSRPTAVPRPWAPLSWPQSMLPSLYPMPGAEAAPTPPKVNTIRIYHHCNLPPGPTSHQTQLWGKVGDNTPFGPDGENLILHIQASKSWPFSPASLEAFHTQVFQVWGEKSSTSMSYLSPLDCPPWTAKQAVYLIAADPLNPLRAGGPGMAGATARKQKPRQHWVQAEFIWLSFIHMYRGSSGF